MVMAVAVFYQGKCLTIAVGYESGHATVIQQVDGQGWQILYMSKPHSQPVLSLDLASSRSFFITSSADAIIAKHPIPIIPLQPTPFLNPPPLAAAGGESSKFSSSGGPLLSQGLVSAGASNGKGKSVKPKIEIQTIPIKTSQTKHSGQQGLRIRSDGMILATAGWDCRVRVYSTHSLKELAVLKWHKEGCYAVAFADLFSPGELERGRGKDSEPVDTTEPAEQTTDLVAFSRVTKLIGEQRALKVMTTHWLAAGSKDGKISLWEIY
jgi:ASTRA-associated protein 1